MIDYNKAISLLNNGEIIDAYESLVALDGYKDSAAKANEIFDRYTKEKLKVSGVEDIISFGAYEQDNNTSNGKEAIEWLVLAKEGDKTLVISRYALDCQQYNTSYTNVTWETCSLRKWLNETFISNAFSSDEQKLIQNTTVTADKNPTHGTSPGKNTTDKVFLFSVNEAERYFSSDNVRACKPTQYALTNGAYANNNNSNCCWWLRSPGIYQNDAAFVRGGGNVYVNGDDVNDTSVAVRPAMWIEFGT